MTPGQEEDLLRAGRAEELLRKARERREEETRREVREKIAAGVEADADAADELARLALTEKTREGATLLASHDRNLAARIREGALG